ncbi:MAG: hypothetical protein HND47_06695 [Chloroflexi bacterium]|nr:hypothetical protein [Chloroflexota bacterium]
MSGSFLGGVSRFAVARWWLMMFIVTGVIACGDPSAQADAKSTPCPPEEGNANVYRSTPHPWLSLIYQYSGMTVPVSTPQPNATPGSMADLTVMIPATGIQAQQVLMARYAALQFLIEKAQRWSDTRMVRLDNSSEAYIIVTFIHPELVQAVYLNSILENTYLIPEIEKQMDEVMRQVATREELLFMVTMVAYNRDSLNTARHTLDIPIGGMRLTNAEDLSIPPLHDDHNLDQPMDTTQKPVFGFLGYPIGVQSNGKCVWVLDTKYNTNIVIVADSVLVDGIPKGSLAWTIRYQSLIDPGFPVSPPDFAVPPNYDLRLLSPLFAPPENAGDPNFWRDFSRFIWGQVTFGN